MRSKLFPIIVPVAALAYLGQSKLWAAELAEHVELRPHKSADRITIEGDMKHAVFCIESRSGIGQATIVRRRGGWPEIVTLRFLLGGLENFSLTAGKRRIVLAVSSHDEGPRVRFESPPDEQGGCAAQPPPAPIVRLRDRQGQPTRQGPPHIGAIEIDLPKGFLDDQLDRFEFSWIDFYR